MLLINDSIRYIVRHSNHLFNDKSYLKLLYLAYKGEILDIEHGQTFSAKLQWLKLHHKRTILTDLVDKIKVKDIVGKIIGEEYIIPTLRIWDSPEEMKPEDFNSMPDRFVIKTNHSGGNLGVYLCTDKRTMNLRQVKKKMAKSLGTDIFTTFREWPYKNIEKKILAEEFIGEDLIDYKFFCFNGEVDSVMLCIGRNSSEKTRFYFFDPEWNLRRYNIAGKNAPEGFTVDKPERFDKMIEIASKLSKGFPFVRVDLYNTRGHIYFGELTFFPDSGLDPNILPEAELYLGSKIDLSLVGDRHA